MKEIGMRKYCFHGCKKNVFRWLLVNTAAFKKGYKLFSIYLIQMLCQYYKKLQLSDNKQFTKIYYLKKCPKSNILIHNIGQWP